MGGRGGRTGSGGGAGRVATTGRGAGAGAGRGSAAGCLFLEQRHQLIRHGAGEFAGVGYGDGPCVVACDVVADADGDQFDGRIGLDLVDDLPQMGFQIGTTVHGQCAVIDRRAVRDHHQDTPLLRAAEQAAMRPGQRLAVDVLLQQPLAHHQREVAACTAPGRVGGFVDDVAKIVQTAWRWRFAIGQPLLARLPAFPGSCRETQNLNLHAAALQGAGEDLGTAGRDHDRTPTHRSGIVDDQCHHRVFELRIAFVLEGERVHRVDHNAREAGGVQHPLLKVEIPGPALLRQQTPL